MIDPEKVRQALEAKRDQFVNAQTLARQDIEALRQALGDFKAKSLQEVEAALANIEAPGARPTAEHDAYPEVIVPFGHSWENHQDAREWAMQTISGIPTLAVDGSQIASSKDISVPVGVVQVGWYENPHQPDARYVKDIAVDILGPDELSGQDQDDSGFSDWQINWKRFEMEVDCLLQYMQSRAGSDPKPLCFFDGSFVVSFVDKMLPERQQRYTDAVIRLLETSEQTGIPVVGYIDTTYARDIASLVSAVTGFRPSRRISDAAMLKNQMNWGDRSQVYICARDDAVLARYYESVCFTYLKTTTSNPPARVELPRWVYEQGECDKVLDIVRAECVIGVGYPYPIETVDSVAVLNSEDRDRFYRIFQEFTRSNNLPLQFSRKATSKRNRRR